jgi:DAK2 domain fusion protein YloV
LLELLDDSAIRRWSTAASDAIAEHEVEINGLNVFPVPDGDTGTNLTLTLTAAADALSRASPGNTANALKVMSRGAVLGARGNSGVIVAQILRGMAESVHESCGVAGCDGPALQLALSRATERAYSAVAEPVEGTSLSVVRAAAAAARTVASTPARLSEVVRAAVDGAGVALARTTDQLPALTRAGVIDAGGRGLVVVLDALAAIVTGDARSSAAPAARPARALLECTDSQSRYSYEVQYLLDAPDSAVTVLRAELAAVGDSVTMAGTGDGVWNVHVHVDDIGAAIEAGVRAGRPHRISVLRFADQFGATDQPASGTPSIDRHGVAVVAVAPGPGLAHLFEAEGVRVVGGGPTDNPSTAEVLAAVLASHAAQVILLPNAAQVTAVADIAAAEARAEGIEVVVIPTRSPVQGLAAVAVHDGGRRFGDDVIAMAEAAAATRWAEVTIAEREALTSAGRCAAGDVLGLIAGEVVEIGTSITGVARVLIDRLIGVGGELITILVGEQIATAIGQELADYVAAAAPGVEVSVFEGGQPDFPLLIGVE